MEYLMTYGWAILIIAVVLGALFGLGFFNSANLAPKVSAGSCQVYRPEGPGTTSFVNLEGTCNNELPQYVASYSSSSYIITGTSGLQYGSPTISEFAWIYYPTAATNYQNIYIYASNSGYNGIALAEEPSPSHLCANTGQYASPCPSTTLTLSAGVWNFVGLVYAGGSTFTVYLNGQGSTEINSGVVNSPASSKIGGSFGGWAPFVGLIANIQVYNTSLTANEITALYDEGIGGAPILPQYLVGWWPLNGNANDYSGNNNNGVPYNIIYVSAWTSGYTAP